MILQQRIDIYSTSEVSGSARFPHSHGFTLIEVLVVLVIIAIITAVAVLSFGGFGTTRHEKIIVHQFERVIYAAKQQAILTPEVLQLRIDKNGYQFFENSKPLRDDVLSNKTAFQHYFKIKLKPASVQIHFSPSGYITPFVLELQGKKKLFVINSAASDFANATS